MTLKHINELSAKEAETAFYKCCGCDYWASKMAQSRPFNDGAQLHQNAEAHFSSMSREDWLQAFAAHPKIGDVESLKNKYGATKDWAQNEQSGVKDSSIATIEGLAQGNKAYEEKFGYIFIVCATGKSAGEMLAILNSRLPNAPSDELHIAADEQKKITYIRLDKLQNEQ
ncbi:MAG TPA: 2-oxo-4-hydroxy-4-carboxy-5-ureidoimidazoline decarboxylase [Planktothrix sp.]|jgi:2-oxo-4-hydroxy-4-carboxy-5-ureidoimidazoline decarboxylase